MRCSASVSTALTTTRTLKSDFTDIISMPPLHNAGGIIYHKNHPTDVTLPGDRVYSVMPYQNAVGSDSHRCGKHCFGSLAPCAVNVCEHPERIFLAIGKTGHGVGSRFNGRRINRGIGTALYCVSGGAAHCRPAYCNLAVARYCLNILRNGDNRSCLYCDRVAPLAVDTSEYSESIFLTVGKTRYGVSVFGYILRVDRGIGAALDSERVNAVGDIP